MEIVREDVNKWIAGRLKMYREENKVTLSRMASLTGRPAATLSAIENGERRVTMETVISYSEKLGVPMHQLFGEEYRELSPELTAVLKALPPEKAEALAKAAKLLYPECFVPED